GESQSGCDACTRSAMPSQERNNVRSFLSACSVESSSVSCSSQVPLFANASAFSRSRHSVWRFLWTSSALTQHHVIARAEIVAATWNLKRAPSQMANALRLRLLCELGKQFGDVLSVLRSQSVRARPNELQASKDGDHGYDSFQFLGGNFACQEATDNHSWNPTSQQQSQNWRADGADGPVRHATDNGENKTEQQVSSNNLSRGHFGVVEEQHGSQRACARRREAGLDSDREC